MKDSEERYHRLSDAAFEGIVITEKGVILEVNDAFCRMVGYDPADIINKPAFNLIPSEENDRVRKKMTAAAPFLPEPAMYGSL